MERFWKFPPVNFVVEIVETYFAKRISRSAAALAYFLILTFFPVLICINAFIGLLNLDVNMVLNTAKPFLPAESLGVLGDYLSYITDNQSTALLVAGLGMTIYSASSAFRILMHTMDELYGRDSYKGIWHLAAGGQRDLLGAPSGHHLPLHGRGFSGRVAISPHRPIF